MKKFFANFFITGIFWLIYNTFFFCIFVLFLAVKSYSGSGELTITEIKSYRISLVIFSILEILFFIGFFFAGKKVLFKYKNPILTFLSCFSSYAVIADKILRSNTLLAFTRSYLDILFHAVYLKYQDLTPPLSEAEFWIWYNEVSDRHRLAFELATSNLLNALFAAIPFVIMFIGLMVRKTKNRTENTVNTGDGTAS